MPNFTPETTIFFAATGVDDHNKTVHDTTSAFVSWAKTRRIRSEMTQCSFQRIDQNWSIRVDHDLIDYDMLLLADTVCLTNGNGYYYVGIIDRVEWKNPNCSYVFFHLDWYSSMLGNIDYEESYCYVEREHVSQDWNGSNPEFSNMGVDEGFSTHPDTPVYTNNHPFTFDNQQVMVFTPYDSDGKPQFEGTMKNGLYTAMGSQLMSVSECNEYLKKIAESDEADLGNIVSIVAVPQEFTGSDNKTWIFPMPWIDHVPSVPDFNNSKCWSGEFCQIKISTGTGQTISINPQWFGSNKSQFTLDVNIFFNNGDGGCTISAVNENTSYKKECYGDFSVAINGLPQSPWVGNAYAQWKAANMDGFFLQNLGTAMTTIIGTINGIQAANSIGNGGVSSWDTGKAILGGVAAGFTQAGSISRTIGNARTSGTVLGGGQSTDINTAVALGKYGVQVVFLMCQQYIMKSVDSYFDRFGYKVNRLKKLNRKARPIWTYIKCHECNLRGNYIPQNARMYIEQMLMDGCTFWKDGNTIGDYSNAKGNKA